jgi:tetratricopeptide (TPR) repeat protein
MWKGMDDLFSDPRFRNQLLKRLEEGWTYDKIEPMSTEEIFRRLNRLGIAVTPEAYRATAQRYESAAAMAEEWYAQYTLQPEGPYDEDFVWMAAVILWPRLIPDRISFEQINHRMQEGYDLLEQHRAAQACDAWWQVWEWLKEKVTPERNTLEALDQDFRGTQSVFNWCQHFEMELWNTGLDDPNYLQLRIRYCREFLETFPHEECSLRGNFLRAEAETLWELGEIQTAKARFQALIEVNPDWAWGYIGWSDEYWLMKDSPKEYDQAEAILRQALARPGLEDREDVLDRLKQLRAERAQARSSKGRKRRRRRRKR